MRHLTSRLSLRALLSLDALSCAAMGTALLAAPVQLGRWMALPPALLREAGLALLLIAAFVAWLASRPTVPRWGLSLVVAGNGFWAMGSVLLPMLGLVSPSLPGWLFLLGQAGAVALLAWLEAGARSAPAVA
ncbi:hypothetical protein ACFOD4_20810 [Pseudoroseomonas globiformis]|uniref:Uncharacterized protein n=1 Tax=Teichococcus globiformis TaxID=2307229 RepID=A0ABV7GA55_9PROT